MDGTHLRHQAAVLAELAGQARDAARRTGACTGVVWSSLAADRFREALAHQARLVHGCADLLEEASAALATHAGAVQAVASPATAPRAGDFRAGAYRAGVPRAGVPATPGRPEAASW